MKMILRRIAAADAKEVAGFLDSRALVLRWLVAFFQHFEELPSEEERYWSLWRGDACDATGLQSVVAHFFQSGTTYVCAEPTADLPTLEDLFDEELLPEKVVGEAGLLDRWRVGFPGFTARASDWKEITVLESTLEPGCRAEPPGFRGATLSDLPALEQYGQLLEAELEQEFARDFRSLVEHGLVFVVEEGGRLKGYVRSNFSDGRYVHAGGLYVHPLYRKSGVGRSLARGLAVRALGELGARVILDAYAENMAAVRAYEHAGYACVGHGLEARFGDGAWRG